MALAITAINPATGSAAGGTIVTVTGTDLDTVDAVFVGNLPAQIIGTSTAVQLKFRTPPGVAGNATVHLVDNDTNTEEPGPVPFLYTATPAAPEQLVSTGARKWKLDVDSSPAKDGSAFIPVRGVQEFQPSKDATMQDDSDYDSDGYGSDAKMGLKWSLVCKFLRKKGVQSNVYDPGQEIIREASEEFGGDGIVRVRWYERDGGGEAYDGFAQVQWGDDGGNTTALSTVSCTLGGQGKKNPIANPAGA